MSRVYVMVMVLVNGRSIRRITFGFSYPRGRGFGLGLLAEIFVSLVHLIIDLMKNVII